MLDRGSDVFIQFPDEAASRTLHAARVVEVRDGLFIAHFDNPDTRAEPGADITVFFHGQRSGFMQQPARIAVVLDEADHRRSRAFGFQTTGEAASGESRECYRVSTLTTGYTATVDNEPKCPLVDTSATGFAVIASAKHAHGAVLTVEVEFENITYRGRARVQCVKPLTPGRTRYGMRCLASTDPRSLLTAMQRISMAVQREQLRRRAGLGS